jgi:hypothetical protein
MAGVAPSAAGLAGRRRPGRLVTGGDRLGQRPGLAWGELTGANPVDRGRPGSKYHLTAPQAPTVAEPPLSRVLRHGGGGSLRLRRSGCGHDAVPAGAFGLVERPVGAGDQLLGDLLAVPAGQAGGEGLLLGVTARSRSSTSAAARWWRRARSMATSNSPSQARRFGMPVSPSCLASAASCAARSSTCRTNGARNSTSHTG